MQVIMLSTIPIQDNQWRKIVRFLRTYPNVYVGKEVECRRFLEGVLWITQSDTQWRLMPRQYGKWNTLYKRFVRWCDNGVWEAMRQHFADDPDMENFLIFIP